MPIEILQRETTRQMLIRQLREALAMAEDPNNDIVECDIVSTYICVEFDDE